MQTDEWIIIDGDNMDSKSSSSDSDSSCSRSAENLGIAQEYLSKSISNIDEPTAFVEISFTSTCGDTITPGSLVIEPVMPSTTPADYTQGFGENKAQNMRISIDDGNNEFRLHVILPRRVLLGTLLDMRPRIDPQYRRCALSKLRAGNRLVGSMYRRDEDESKLSRRLHERANLLTRVY